MRAGRLCRALILRLNEAHYDVADWFSEGLALADLPFDECATPPAQRRRRRFLAIAEGVDAVAVHCRSGLGRICTLIALYMMKRHRFKAWRAMGWLAKQVVAFRPGRHAPAKARVSSSGRATPGSGAVAAPC